MDGALRANVARRPSRAELINRHFCLYPPGRPLYMGLQINEVAVPPRNSRLSAPMLNQHQRPLTRAQRERLPLGDGLHVLLATSDAGALRGQSQRKTLVSLVVSRTCEPVTGFPLVTTGYVSRRSLPSHQQHLAGQM